MCGIAGLWRRGFTAGKAGDLAPALERMRHRGPDDEGFLVAHSNSRKIACLGGDDTDPGLSLPHWKEGGDVEGDIILGHRRLSILDLSSAGHQPMPDEAEDCWIVFNGEIFNYVELREELQHLGHRFRTGTDTEVILAAWKEWGEDCLHRFNGDWAFALLDFRSDTEPVLFLARDRMGVKPLYFAESDEVFWFASEAKALIGAAVPFQPSEKAILRFLASGDLPAGSGEDTFFENIRQLAPGHAVRIHPSNGKLKKFRWYDLRSAAADTSQPAPDEALSEMETQLTRAVRIRLRADVPVGSCLSGGVDSSAIVGSMRTLLGEKDHGELHSFSAVYRTEGPFNEIDWIRQVVEKTGSEAHYAWPDEQSLAEAFDRMVWHQDEPFQTASIFAQWCVMQEARKNDVVVMLDGQAADELFAGYQPGSYQEKFLEWLRRGNLLTFIREWIARKSATGLGWRVLFRELRQILVHGSTGVLEIDRQKMDPRARLRNFGFREEAADKLYPASQTDPDQLRAKLAEDLEKLTRWTKQLRKSPGDTGLAEKIEKKKTLIASNRHKLARIDPESNPEGFVARFLNRLRVIWNRIRGNPKHDLREYLIRQTTESGMQHLLRFEDRNSMAFSIEARVPFTDFELVEWAFQRANDFKIRKGWTKWVLRTAMKNRVPDSILWRKDKVGFETPDTHMSLRLMNEGELNPADSAFLQQYLEPETMRTIGDRLKAGEANQDEARLIWRWLVLDSWYRQFQEASAGNRSNRVDSPTEQG